MGRPGCVPAAAAAVMVAFLLLSTASQGRRSGISQFATSHIVFLFAGGWLVFRIQLMYQKLYQPNALIIAEPSVKSSEQNFVFNYTLAKTVVEYASAVSYFLHIFISVPCPHEFQALVLLFAYCNFLVQSWNPLSFSKLMCTFKPK